MSPERVGKLAYLTFARLPTEKAHGYQICKTAEALGRAGVEVTLIHPFREQPDPELRATTVFDYYGIERSFRAECLGRRDPLPAARRLHRKVGTFAYTARALLWGLRAVLSARRQGYELHITRSPVLAWWLARFRMPMVLELHRVPERLYRLLLRSVARAPRLDLVVAVTQHMRDELVQLGFDRRRTTVIRNGVDLRHFASLPSRQTCRERIDLPADVTLVGYVGRFRSEGGEKGIPFLIEAIGELHAEHDLEASLLCVGGPLEAVPYYRERARCLGIPDERISFVDRVPNREVPLWIRACDVVTVPWHRTRFSAYQTSPLKLFEYMAAGVPVVASDLPSLREVVRHDREAWLVAPGSAQALADGIATLLKDPARAERLAGAARRLSKGFTWERRAEAIILQHALQGRR